MPGHYLPWTCGRGQALTAFLPSVPIDHDEDPQCSANRLAADLLLDTNNHPLTSIQHTAVSQGCVTQVFLMNVRTPDGDTFPLLGQLDDALAWRDGHTQAPVGKLEWFDSNQATCMAEPMGAPIQEAFSMQGLYTNI